MRGFWIRLFSRPWSGNVAFCHRFKHFHNESRYNRCIPRSGNSFAWFQRPFSVSMVRKYEAIHKVQVDSKVDLKKDAVAIFYEAIRAVQPKVMIQKLLQYNEVASELTVEGKVYRLNHNVYVVGFGNGVMGMTRVVEDILAPHIVQGIIIVPKDLHNKMKELQLDDMLLSQNSKISMYEGTSNNEPGEESYEAAKAIHKLAKKLTDQDFLIVLCSGGGSALCPTPHPPITLNELCDLTQLLRNNGASRAELNVLRKNIEVLKGGGLALAAKPAKVLSLILSSAIGKPVDLIASGPTFPAEPTPHHCMEILKRYHFLDKTPENVRRFLEKECKIVDNEDVHDPMTEKARHDAEWQHVQNLIVGNYSIACEAAEVRAKELGYVPLILMTNLLGEATKVGYLGARLAKFVTLCFDRKASSEPNKELAVLETTLVAEGMKKKWINNISRKVDMAINSDRDICIIAGGSTCGAGIGGKNMETTLAAAIQLNEEFTLNEIQTAENQICFLSGGSDGNKSIKKMTGAVIDLDFLQEVAKSGLDMKMYLKNNDTLKFFGEINGGQNLIPTKLTGSDVMDIMIMLVQRPRDLN